MEIINLMEQRHSVREYIDKEIDSNTKQILTEDISGLNKQYNTNVQIVFDDPNGFANAQKSYGNFSGCKNYVVYVGKDATTCGYVGGLISLKAQSLGLNSCFVALTYKKSNAKKKVNINKGEKIQCSMALGYGKNQGSSHKIKTKDQVLELIGEQNEKLDDVIKACLLAPTAINQQKFKVICKDKNIEIVKSGFGFYTDFDLGIIKSFADLVLGKVEI